MPQQEERRALRDPARACDMALFPHVSARTSLSFVNVLAHA